MQTTNETTLLTIVMPAHNEELEIWEALERLLRALEGVPFKVIVVDDGSSDATLEILTSVKHPCVSVVSHSPNRGKGFAVKRGLQMCSSEFIGYLDGDLDLDPSALIAGYEILRASPEVDGVIGSKLHQDSKVVYSRLRRIFSLAYRALVRILFKVQASDTQTGLKVFRKSSIDSILDATVSEGWAFDLELIARFENAGALIVEVPIKLDYKFTSSLTVRSVVIALQETFGAYFRFRKSRVPRTLKR